MRRRSTKTAIAVVGVGAAGTLFVLAGGGDASRPLADGAPGDITTRSTLIEPLPPRPVLPDDCVLADATLVIELMEQVRVPGGGGVDNPFVSAADGTFDQIVSARILGGEAKGALGLWGITPDGAFVPLNGASAAITATPGRDTTAADVIDDARTTDAAVLASKCTKLSTGG